MDHLLEIIGVWFSGIATLAAVILALFLQVYSERRQRPKLCVEYDVRSVGDNRFLPPSTAGGGPGIDRQELWIRIRVTNNSERTARDVEVRFISSTIEKEKRRNNRPSWWFKVSNFNRTSVAIPPHFPQHFDIAYLVHEISTQQVSAFLAITQPDMLDWPQEKIRIERQGDYTNVEIGWPYTLFFAVVGSNCDATYYQMPLQISPPRESRQSPIGEEQMRACIAAKTPIQITASQAFMEESVR
jgi:hypothetical protein